MRRFGVVGCGVIGSEISRAIDRGIISGRLTALCDTNLQKAQTLLKKLNKKPRVCSLKVLIKQSDVIIEAAGPGAVALLLEHNEIARKTLLVMSAGGLITNPTLVKRASQKQTKILLPSGALAGLDGVRAASVAGITEAVLTTTKPPRGLKGAPYCIQHDIDLDGITKPRCIFSGNVMQAVKGFPANINVAALLAMAGIGPHKTKVRIIADPHTKTNTHQITVHSKAGVITTKTENVPSPSNPKTSYLAVMSAIAALK
ncbi:MAG: DUF108 domain-containing protein [Elusimicrobia bacterium]|nr:DUF108 domain-containing protein [Elusimicrobiota bacterium]MBD3411685.1 DUF108 domain-containing protein [Elusimicrobiota bacterium]